MLITIGKIFCLCDVHLTKFIFCSNPIMEKSELDEKNVHFHIGLMVANKSISISLCLNT